MYKHSLLNKKQLGNRVSGFVFLDQGLWETVKLNSVKKGAHLACRVRQRCGFWLRCWGGVVHRTQGAVPGRQGSCLPYFSDVRTREVG